MVIRYGVKSRASRITASFVEFEKSLALATSIYLFRHIGSPAEKKRKKEQHALMVSSPIRIPKSS